MLRFLSLFEFRILKIFLLLLLFLFIGTAGYYFIEDYPLIDALYMTVITLSTVGFGEVYPLSEVGRVFTILLILSGVGVLAYAASVFAEEMVSGRLVENYKKRNNEKNIKKLNNHVIICGFGRNGRQAARKLKLYKKPYLVIERDLANINSLSHKGLEDTKFVEGDATQDSTLIEAQISSAASLITALPSDADNLFVVLSARQLNPNLKIISRASDTSSMRKLKIAGADNVIMPDKIGGEHMASLIVTPDLVEFLDKLSVDSSTQMNFIEVEVSDFPSEYIGKTIRDLQMRANTGCTVIGIKNNETGEYQISPEYDFKIENTSQLIIFGKPEQIHRLKNYYQL